MLINLGRIVMLVVWGFLFYNLVDPFPVPVNYFLYVAMAFTVIMHGLKVVMISALVQPNEPPVTLADKWSIFIFGIFGLLARQKKLNQYLKTETKS